MLKAVVDMMGRRYTLHDYQPLSLEEILTELGLTELRMDTREWLLQVRREEEGKEGGGEEMREDCCCVSILYLLCILCHNFMRKV